MKQKISINYDNSILAVSNSILKHFNVPPKYKSLPLLDQILAEDYKNVVFLILDGMGSYILENNISSNSLLRKNIMTNISSVFPPTTAAATTAFHSGLPPVKSGWLGWMSYFPQYDKHITLFRNTEYYSDQPICEPAPAETLLKYDSIYAQIIRKNPDIEYHRIFPPFDPNGVQSFPEMCEKIAKTTHGSAKKKIISAYWNEPDHSIHELGVQKPEIAQILQDINTHLENLLAKLKDTVVIISADHGAIDIEEIRLNDYQDICQTFLRPPAFESRFATYFIKEGQQEAFQKAFIKHFHNDFVLYTKNEFLKSEILGSGEQNPLVPDFIGDFVMIATGKRSLRYSTGEKEHSIMLADHSGFTKEEMTVPLIVLTKK